MTRRALRAQDRVTAQGPVRAPTKDEVSHGGGGVYNASGVLSRRAVLRCGGPNGQDHRGARWTQDEAVRKRGFSVLNRALRPRRGCRYPPPPCASTALSKHMSLGYRRFDGIF